MVGKKNRPPYTTIDGERNLFITPDGRWKGYYCPENLRCYPLDFAMIDYAEDKSITLCVDETSPYWHEQGGNGNRLFTEDGEESAFLKQQIELLKRQQLLKEKLHQGLSSAFERELLTAWHPQDLDWLGDQAIYHAIPNFLDQTQNGTIGSWLTMIFWAQLFSMSGMKRLRKTASVQMNQNKNRTPNAIGLSANEAAGLLGLGKDQDILKIDFDQL